MRSELRYQKTSKHSFRDTLTSNNTLTDTFLSSRPFLKWVGGKRSILPELTKRLPTEYNTYYEPFLGGGALYFSMNPENAYLSDINFHLILTFQAVQNDVHRLIRNLKIHNSKHNKEYFLDARKRLFREKDPTKIAALLIYLKKPF